MEEEGESSACKSLINRRARWSALIHLAFGAATGSTAARPTSESWLPVLDAPVSVQTRRPLLAAWACCARRFSGLPLLGRRKGSYGNYHATGEAPVRHARAARAARALRLIEEPRLATVSDFGEPHGPKVDSGP